MIWIAVGREDRKRGENYVNTSRNPHKKQTNKN